MRIRILIMLFIVIALTGMSGCKLFKKTYSIHERGNMVLDYLEGKYGEEFEVISFEPANWAYSYDEIRLYPKGGAEEDSFVVWGTLLDDGTYIMHDSYFGIIIKDDYEEVMSGFVEKIYKEFRLKTDFGEGVLPDRLNKDTEIDDIYNKDELFSSYTIIYVKESSAEKINTEDVLESLAKQMIEKKMVGRVRIYIVYDKSFDLIGTKGFFDLNIKNNKYVNLVEDGKTISVNKNLKILKYWEEN